MDAQAHLLSLGWAGPGHPLHPSAYKHKGHRGLAYDPTANKIAFSQNTYPSNGLIKPLLVSQKQGKLGVGRRAHEPQAGNEWWLKGFEKALGDLGKSESERSSGVSTPVRAPADSGKFGALYSFFVKGGEMEGTIGEEEKQKTKKKRKSDVRNEDHNEKEKREFEDVAAFMVARDKDENRKQRKEKGTAEDQFKAVEAFMAARDERHRKKRKSETVDVMAESLSDVPAKVRKQLQPEQVHAEESPPNESKAERRERRRRRRMEKEANRATKHEIKGALNGNDNVATDALRKAEKKKRKAEKAAKEA